MPDDFDIHAYLESEFADQPVVRAKLHFKPEGAHIASSDRSIWEALRRKPGRQRGRNPVRTGPALACFHFAEFCQPGHRAGAARTARDGPRVGAGSGRTISMTETLQIQSRSFS